MAVSTNQARLRRLLLATLYGLLLLLAWLSLPFDVPYVGYGVASAFLFQIAVRPRRRAILAAFFAGTVLALMDQFVFHYGNARHLHMAQFLGCLGLASFAIVGFEVIFACNDRREELRSILLPAAAFTVFILGSQQLLNLAGMLFPRTADLYAYAFDGSLGFQPSFVIGKLFRDHPWIGSTGHFTYFFLPFPMALVCAAHLRRKISSPMFMLEIFMLAGILGYFLYLAFPAAGPRYVAGPEFPNAPLSYSALHLLRVRMVPIDWRFSRNCMPSLHATWALLVWFNCKPFSQTVRKTAFVFVLITLLDTMGTGEHYLIDLVVAFPFAVAVQAICTRSVSLRARLVPLTGTIALALLWPVILRYGTDVFLLNPVVPWISIVVTMVLSFIWMTQVVPSSLPHHIQLPCSRAVAAGA
jgi:hypothetical protein